MDLRLSEEESSKEWVKLLEFLDDNSALVHVVALIHTQGSEPSVIAIDFLVT